MHTFRLVNTKKQKKLPSGPPAFLTFLTLPSARCLPVNFHPSCIGNVIQAEARAAAGGVIAGKITTFYCSHCILFFACLSFKCHIPQPPAAAADSKSQNQWSFRFRAKKKSRARHVSSKPSLSFSTWPFTDTVLTLLYPHSDEKTLSMSEWLCIMCQCPALMLRGLLCSVCTVMERCRCCVGLAN